MDAALGLMGGGGGGGGGGNGGGGVPSGGSTTNGSILTFSKDNMVLMPPCEASSSNPDEESCDDLELGLGLSIGGLKPKVAGQSWGQYARILTAKDFPCLVSCSSSSSVSIPNSSTSGTKRTATDSVSPPSGTSVVGWPPIRKAHRMPALAYQTKSPNEEFSSMAEENKSKNKTNGVNVYSQAKRGISHKKYQSVKVNMDGTFIGRKVDLNAHTSYETLAQTLEDMFHGIRSNTDAAGTSRLLDGTSEFVLTYEDKDGDCMLVGDVPWPMFLNSVKRLRIMRNTESNGLAPRFQENNRRQGTAAI